ncbi:unnamed protein product [Parnassius apollo]|uniref:(apollo) hypothetical protein n=1 Tax=Parnassius apollo TaxID=110799 RepID=A0A8S3Y439_PARAO|nr:unnamed protein product [Parnassius apollo]
MAGKLFPSLLIFILKLQSCWFDNTFTEIPLENESLNVVTNTGGNMCTTKMDTCSLKVATKYIRGLPGPPGEKGERGVDGQKGDKGLRGPPGTIGKQGICELSDTVSDADSPEGSMLGDKLEPLNGLCKDYPDLIKVLTNGTKWIKKSSPFEVTCKETGLTCLASVKNTKQYDYTKKLEPFWLSELGFDFNDFYGVTTHQINYLQARASSVSLTIRYHCKNSVVLPENTDKSLRILLWNDVIISPYPGKKTPLYYNILNDNCKELGDYKSKWLYTDISIVSQVVHRLPAIDFHIQDVRDENQYLSLEVKELCFG